MKPEPDIVTSWLTPVCAGENPVSDRVAKIVKSRALLTVPPGVMIVILPVVAPTGTVAKMTVVLLTVKDAAFPLKDTAVAPVKFIPVSSTSFPTRPLSGVKLLRIGAGITVKFVELLTVPSGVVIAILPVVAPTGTVTVILVELTTV